MKIRKSLKITSPLLRPSRFPPLLLLARLSSRPCRIRWMERATDLKLPFRRVVATGKGHFRTLSVGHEQGDLTVSSLGLGTYLGPETEKANREYEDVVIKALSVGINVLDTAINYRGTRRKCAIGHAVANAITHGLVDKNQVMICTKGGYLTLGIDPPSNPRLWVEETFVQPGIFSWDDFAAGCHCMTPGYINHQFLENINCNRTSKTGAYDEQEKRNLKADIRWASRPYERNDRLLLSQSLQAFASVASSFISRPSFWIFLPASKVPK